MKYKIAIAGSTKNTVLMAQAIAADDRFEVAFTLSPTPKAIGRKQILVKNPLQVWSEKEKIPAFLVDHKIDKNLLKEFSQVGEIDFLLVVDFGYLVPKWLLSLPKIAPLNIHPSLLPKWRGSSPGQFCLLFQDLDENGKQSAVTLMIMNEGLDQGPIIAQIPFTVEENWTQNEYYAKAFSLMGTKLTDLMVELAEEKITPQAQPSQSPTMIAGRLNKEDSFIAWSELQKLMDKNMAKIDWSEIADGGQLLIDLIGNQQFCPNKLAQVNLVINACKAFNPWPNLWTIVQTNKGEKRMKIISCHLEKESLVLDRVQIEGKNPCLWNECKNTLV